MVRTVSLVAAIVSLAAPACLLTDLSGLSGGSDAGATDGSAPDTEVDASGGDADAGADTIVSTEAGTTCPGIALPATCDPGLLADPLNCCVKGRSCGGGTCVSGQCQPVTVVPDATTDARGIALSGSTLVWATGCNDQLRRVRTDGTGNTALPPGSNCTPTLSLSGSNAYWIEWNGPNLMTTPLDGSQQASVVAVVPGSGARADFARLATDAARAYWAMQSPPSVWYAPLDGGGATPSPLATQADAGATKEVATSPYGVAVDGTDVYWADPGANALKRRALSSLGTDILADVVASETGPRDLALDAARVYWLTTDGFVRARAKDLATPAVTLASGQSGAESIIVDDRYVYWTTYVQNGTVSRVPKAGGAVEVLAANQNWPYSLTQDCDTVYWTNQANFATGAVMKVAK